MQRVAITIEGQGGPLVSRARAILKDRIEERWAAQVVEGQAEALITLAVDSELQAEAFRLEKAGAGVRVSGGSPRGLLYGVGKFLRTSRYDDGVAPSAWRGTSVPRGSLRGMYFAMHFHNFYHLASDAEIVRYTEDLALWGVNAVMVIYPFLNLENWEDLEEYQPDLWVDVTNAFDTWRAACGEHELLRGEISFDYLHYYSGLAAKRGAEVGVKYAVTVSLPPISRKRRVDFFPIDAEPVLIF